MGNRLRQTTPRAREVWSVSMHVKEGRDRQRDPKSLTPFPVMILSFLFRGSCREGSG